MEQAQQLPNGHHRDYGGFFKLQEIQTNAATPSTMCIDNLKKNIKIGLPKLNELPEFQKVKGHDVPIAIVGGGPSLKRYIHELKDFKTIIACGSSHDFIREHGFVPTYAAICDPDPISVNYYQKLHTETKYLLASSVDEKIMEHFKEHQRVMWHCHSADYNMKEIEELEGKPYDGISGGCTVGLRSINIAIMMGYSNIHFFGFDSCLEDQVGHAYPVSEEEVTNFGRLYRIKVRKLDGEGPADRVYMCVGYQMAQAYNFKDFYLRFGRLFTPTFHCDGLLPDLFKVILATLGTEETVSKEI